jgi:hypothetical protein
MSGGLPPVLPDKWKLKQMAPLCSRCIMTKKKKIPHLFRQTFGNQNRWQGSMVTELSEHATRNLNRSMENSLFFFAKEVQRDERIKHQKNQ